MPKIKVELSAEDWTRISNILSMLQESPGFAFWDEHYEKALERLQEEIFRNDKKLRE